MAFDPDNYDHSRLSIELVPNTAWWSNVRSNVSRTDWEKCKEYTRRKSGGRCEICGGVGRRWPTEAHEQWHYDDDRSIQTLVDLIALCPSCHECKHFGRAEAVGNRARALRHLTKVNGWSESPAERYIRLQFQIWAIRSSHEWMLDVSFLSLLGINPRVGDREANANL